MQPIRAAAAFEANDLVGVDHLDFGCSNGGSLKLGQSFFGGKVGLGIDIDPSKVARTKEAGFRAVVADATQLNISARSVSFCTMLHFLEHLPDARTAEKCIASAARVARNFVYIRHPWFDSDYQLMKHGLKCYWSDWHGHPNRCGVFEIFKAVARLQIERYIIFGVKRIESIRSAALVPLLAKMDSQAADEQAVAARADVVLSDTYYEVACVLQIRPAFSIETLNKKLINRGHETIFDSKM